MNEPLSIGVKRIENGTFSRELVDDTKPDSTLTTIGSGGFFTLPEEIGGYEQVFFFAAGSGITPIYSLLKTALHFYPRLRLVLIYSNHDEDKAIFLPQLKKLQHDFPQQFHLELLFSVNPELIKARLHSDLISQLLDKFAIGEKTKILSYVCGPKNYMRMCMYRLQEEGIPADNIRKESFITEPAAKAIVKPPDEQTHRVFISFNSRKITLDVSYPDSILSAAKKVGIILPYSCETGRCGSCAARCINGTVWHSYNEVLTEKDLDKGLVLTCVGHPVHGDVELVI